MPLEKKEECPLGWSFNPSSRAHRRRAAVFAGSALLLSVYMALYQFGVTSYVGFLAALLYALELWLLLSGDDRRWERTPLLTAASVGLGLALCFGSVILFLLQPIAVGHWCTICLLVLLSALLLAQRIVAEGFALLQALLLGIKAGHRVRQMLRFGIRDQSTSLLPADAVVSRWNEGVSVTWPLTVSIGIGIGLLFLPTLFVLSEVARINIFLFGVLTICCSMLAMAEPLRRLRLLNCFTGVILIAWQQGQVMGVDRWTAFVAGIVLIGLNVHKGTRRSTFGIWARI